MAVDIRNVVGFFQEKFAKEHTDLLNKWLDGYMKRLVKDLQRIAEAKIMETGRGGTIEFFARRSGEKEITLTTSNPVLFKALEMGEFDENGNLVTPPHSVMKEWRVFVRTT